MNPVRILQRKRDGARLTADEIAAMIDGYVAGQIPDYQISAWAMAILFRGMDATETAALTHSMLHSGATLSWDGIAGPFVDKHSTGGVGDKVSLPLAPLLASCDLRVPMISGRGLGLTGGTLDKLDAIPGFRTALSTDDIRDLVKRVGVAMAGQTDDLVPADRKLYALRDVTATVPSIPLITASILSKKAAESLDALVLDVKWGKGAFMQTLPEARRLAHSLVQVATQLGLKTTALLTDMNQPLGRMVGHAVEVNESLACLAGEGPEDLERLVIALGSELLLQVGRATSASEAESLLKSKLASGAAREKFDQMVAAQGGRLTGPLPTAPALDLIARRSGFVVGFDLEKLGYGLTALGAGRTQVSDTLDHGVGVEALVKLGDEVSRKQPMLRVFVREKDRDLAIKLFEDVVEIGDAPGEPLPLIVARVDAASPAPEEAAVEVSSERPVVAPLETKVEWTAEAIAAACLPPPEGDPHEREAQALLAAAAAVRNHAYAPFSGFPVGAALLTRSGKTFVGVNVENASYGLTQCAERSAATSAVAAGETDWVLLAVASRGGATPCGACRQVLAEFCTDLPVLLLDVDRPDEIRRVHLSELLPCRFDKRALSDGGDA